MPYWFNELNNRDELTQNNVVVCDISTPIS